MSRLYRKRRMFSYFSVMSRLNRWGFMKEIIRMWKGYPFSLMFM